MKYRVKRKLKTRTKGIENKQWNNFKGVSNLSPRRGESRKNIRIKNG